MIFILFLGRGWRTPTGAPPVCRQVEPPDCVALDFRVSGGTADVALPHSICNDTSRFIQQFMS